MDQVVTRFKQPKTPHKIKKVSAASKRPGMDPKHLANIRKLPSCVSGLRPCDPHHLKKRDERGVSLKATDRWAVPVTRKEHDQVQPLNATKEEAWFAGHGIDCYALANALWANRGNLEKMELIIETHRGLDT